MPKISRQILKKESRFYPQEWWQFDDFAIRKD